MRKHILIIGNPGTESSDSYCAGVLKDLNNYKNYFMSCAGGEWYEDEITTMIKPLPKQVETELQLMNRMDYSIIVFSGHGYFWKNQTMVELRPGTNPNDTVYDMPESCFRNDGRRLIILDCCRKKFQLYNTDENLSESTIKHYALEKSTRKGYEETIAVSAKVNIILYSCDIDECSNDDSRLGGTYSYNLLTQARNDYTTMAAREYKTAVTVHDEVTQIVKNISNGSQNPAVAKPRIHFGTNYVPFVVKG